MNKYNRVLKQPSLRHTASNKNEITGFLLIKTGEVPFLQIPADRCDHSANIGVRETPLSKIIVGNKKEKRED